MVWEERKRDVAEAIETVYLKRQQNGFSQLFRRHLQVLKDMAGRNLGPV